MHLISKHFIALFFLFSFSSLSYAGGVALAATRIVYPMDAKQTSITLNNTDKRLRFLVQSWIDDSQDQKSNEFIVTPPLFVSKPESENKLRIIYAGKALPNDRESLFWLNTKAIPEIEREEIKDKNYIYQEYYMIKPLEFVKMEDEKVKLEDFSYVTGLFAYNKKFIAPYMRIGNAALISSAREYYVVSSLKIKEK